ncbi:hypothetical protein [Nocardioides mangrovi]|uniref:Uncharacterized protein n=1 Tax=Nocardioides mangrovi TaxID=2874580 RepID=A0ABS7UGK2_9ACTN|nr:hypothetical protein [Nocardioides mangrovi]MBZ5739806.1 hypothetical protein [Nocardioides mangrovi]
MTTGVRLCWLPLGADGRVVRRCGRAWEAWQARRQHRRPQPLFHAALEVVVDGDRWTVEMAPAWSGPATERGVVGTGPVGLRPLGRSRLFRYEVRVWRDGTIPDLATAVGGPSEVDTDGTRAHRLLAVLRGVPTPTWGRDELRLGEMWNSNSVVAWALAASGHDVTGLRPPGEGRAPGWDAGLRLAAAPSWRTGASRYGVRRSRSGVESGPRARRCARRGP